MWMTGGWRSGGWQRGLMGPWVAVALVALLGIAAFAIDLSMVYVAKQQLQTAVDAAALAAVARMRWGPDGDAIRTDALAVAQENLVLGDGVIIEPDDVLIGLYDQASGEFTEGWPGDTLPQVKVTGRRTQDSPNGPVNMSFARVFGIQQVGITATAMAGLSCQGRPRLPVEMAIVQDCSGSFQQEIEVAKDADQGLVQLVHDNCMAGDDGMGVVAFNTQGYYLGGRRIPNGTDFLMNKIESINSQVPVWGYTYTELGIQLAHQLLNSLGSGDAAEQVIVLVSDGMPNPYSHRQLTVDACDAAAADNITIHTVTYDEDSQGGHYGSMGSDAEFNATLVRNGGYAFHTPSADELGTILITVGVIEIGHPMLVQ